jgi:hypothetical protein
MKSRARNLLDKSIGAMLAAVEIYNKPAFAYREESFAILAVNSWELLLKARILQIDGNRLAAVLEYERRKRADGSLSERLSRKKNRAGNNVTVGLFKAHDRLVNEYKDTVDTAIRKNLEALVEVRDNAIHFFNADLGISAGIHEIGAAALKNYIAAVRQWFAVDLSRYQIVLMPLAFLSQTRSAEGVVLNAEERHFLQFLKELRNVPGDDAANDFNVALGIEVYVRRSKLPDATPVVVSNVPGAVVITFEEEDIRERYPWDYNILTARLKKRYSDFKINGKYHEIRRELEKDASYCRERLLDPGNPKSSRKNFYNPNVVRKFDEHYERRKQEKMEEASEMTAELAKAASV